MATLSSQAGTANQRGVSAVGHRLNESLFGKSQFVHREDFWTWNNPVHEPTHAALCEPREHDYQMKKMPVHKRHKNST